MEYVVGVYWGPREESREECAERIASHMRLLAEIEPSFSKWIRCVSRRKKIYEPYPFSSADLAPLLDRNYTDIGHELIPSLGYSIYAPTSDNAPMRGMLSVSCGVYSERVDNAAVVNFYSDAEPNRDLLQRMLVGAIETYDPDSGKVWHYFNVPDSVQRGKRVLYTYKRGAGIVEGELDDTAS